MKFGYICYWISFFKVSPRIIDKSNSFLDLKTFFKEHENLEVKKDELEKLFSSYMHIKKDARLCTYNNFMKKHLIPYKVVSKRYRLSRNVKRTRWIAVPL